MPCSRNDSAPFRARLIGSWRHGVQWAGAILVLITPFLRPGGTGLLRIDLPQRRLELFGRLLLLDELHLLLLAGLSLVVLFLLATLVLGRLWCGWACPQTTLADLAEGVARRLRLQVAADRVKGPRGRLLLFHGFCLALALLVAANMVWYVLPPPEFFGRLVRGDLGATTTLTLAILAGIVYLDLAFVRRLLCREFCPYGRFQTALVDAGTLTLRFAPETAGDCLDCGACLRACPTDIDIRQGFQVECIACGSCLDACRRVMAPHRRRGLIRYRFGEDGRGPATLLNARTLLLAAVFTGLSVALAVGTAHRDAASFTLSRSAAPPRLLADGGRAVFYTGYVADRTGRPVTLGIRATAESGRPIELRGPVKIALAAYQRRRLDFAAILPPRDGPSDVVFILEGPEGERLIEVRTTLPLAFEEPRHEH